MTDNQIYAILFPLIKGGLTSRGVTGVEVLQNAQPTQQGTPSGPAVFLSMLRPVPRGHVRRDSVYDRDTGVMSETELQTYEQTYQVNALSAQDPTDVNKLTASDLVKVVRQIVQSSAFIASIRASGLGILRVNELRNPAFVNDKDRFEYSPSFDFTLTYDELYTTGAPVVETVEYNINRV